MKRKYFQILMSPVHHQRMKQRAQQLGVPIGKYVENLISSMERKVDKVQLETGIHDVLFDPLFVRMLFRNDFLPDREGIKEALNEQGSLEKYEWKTTI